MGTIELYSIFCISTAIVGILQIYLPIHKKLKETHINNIVTKAPYLSTTIFFIIGIICAPILFLISIFPTTTNIFIEAMYSSIIEVKK